MEIVTDYAYLEILSKNNFKANLPFIKEFRSYRFEYGETFIKNEVKYYLENNTRYVTYLVKSKTNDDILAYFTISASAIFWEPCGNMIKNPAIEINFFSLNDKLTMSDKKPIKGLGKLVFEEFVLPTIKTISKYLGVSTIILFAIPSLNDKVINAYKKMGFVLIDDKDVEEYILVDQIRNCKLMCYTLSEISKKLANR
ncbi:hypothetical protein [Dielma fastidiosa]|uniref:GNAT family N-acetyltransferase n=1 Tax=Dielma fastidiosa TaxID=1034346 RepID=A0A318KC37_9FIRM|nr:hypothetical protein [Dielma fastidiosa]PXX73651.1 hypothetical protein DES51_1351 [Dielma fastidiosa]